MAPVVMAPIVMAPIVMVYTVMAYRSKPARLVAGRSVGEHSETGAVVGTDLYTNNAGYKLNAGFN